MQKLSLIFSIPIWYGLGHQTLILMILLLGYSHLAGMIENVGRTNGNSFSIIMSWCIIFAKPSKLPFREKGMEHLRLLMLIRCGVSGRTANCFIGKVVLGKGIQK